MTTVLSYCIPSAPLTHREHAPLHSDHFGCRGSTFPYTNVTNTTSNATCSTQPFQVIGFETFTAAPGPWQPGMPEAFGGSHLSFLFIDLNFGRPGFCIRSLAAGAEGSENYYPCTGKPDLEYLFDGKVLGLKHSFDCQR